MSVLPEDAEWFRSLARQHNLQNGWLFHLMRRYIEENASFVATQFELQDRSDH